MKGLWRLSRSFRAFSDLQPIRHYEEELAAAHSVARILDSQEANSSLEALNQAVRSIVIISSKKVADRMHLGDKRCLDLVEKVMSRIGEMSSNELVDFCVWFAKARMLKFGWKDMTIAERDFLAQRLVEFSNKDLFSIKQLMSLLYSLADLRLTVKPIEMSIERKLTDTKVNYHFTDLKTLLEMLSRFSHQSIRLLGHVISRLDQMDLSLVDPLSLISVYQNLAMAEFFYHSGDINRFAGKFRNVMFSKLHTFGESEFLEFLEAHKVIKYPRPATIGQLLVEAGKRLDKPEILSKTFLFQIMKTFASFKESKLATPSSILVRKLFIEVSKHISSPYVGINEFELLLRSMLTLANEYPPQLIEAVRKKINFYNKENTSVVTAIRFLARANVDYSNLLKHVKVMEGDMHNYAIAERLVLLDNIYHNEAPVNFDALEQAIFVSCKEMLAQKQIYRSWNLLHRILSYPNPQIQKKLQFVKTMTLESLISNWSTTDNVYWVLYQTLLMCKGNEELWVKMAKSRQAMIRPDDVYHAINIVTNNDNCGEAVILCLETFADKIRSETVFLAVKLLADMSDRKMLERYFRLVDKQDAFSCNKVMLLRGIDYFIQILSKNPMEHCISNFLASLAAFRKTLRCVLDRPNEISSKLSVKIIDLLSVTGHLTPEEICEFVERANAIPVSQHTATVVGLRAWPLMKSKGYTSRLVTQLYTTASGINLLTLKSKITSFLSIPERLDFDHFLKRIEMRLHPIPHHLYFLNADIVNDLPSRYFTEHGEFIKQLHILVATQGQHPEAVLSPAQRVRYLNQLTMQGLYTSSYKSMIERILANYDDLIPSDKVKFLTALSTMGKKFEEGLVRVSKDIEKEPKPYLQYAAHILGALSDGDLQNEVWSAKVANALIHSSGQSFYFSPNELAKVMMFCVRMGMENTSLMKRLLAFPPPEKVSNFDFKRYLLHLYFKGVNAKNFTHPTEFTSYLDEIKSSAWRYFIDSELRESVAKELGKKNIKYEDRAFIKDYYVPFYLPEQKISYWQAPKFAKIMNKGDALSGDYQLYLQLAKKVAGMEVMTKLEEKKTVRSD